ncbi:hypothetical protein J6590_048166 [Homalodisca vitripennis]|nr:hypothetical protein J6590_048166 [Homalodisca vitripennis]
MNSATVLLNTSILDAIDDFPSVALCTRFQWREEALTGSLFFPPFASTNTYSKEALRHSESGYPFLIRKFMVYKIRFDVSRCKL